MLRTVAGARAGDGGAVMSGHPKCRWCTQRHEPRWLCDPAVSILDALYDKGMRGNMPTIEFPEIPLQVPGLDADMVLLGQATVMGATVPAAGDVPFPALVLSGRDHRDKPLPRWFYAAADEQITAFAVLVDRMAKTAIRAAEQQRAGQGR